MTTIPGNQQHDERPRLYDPDSDRLEPDEVDRSGRRYLQWQQYEASQVGHPERVNIQGRVF